MKSNYKEIFYVRKSKSNPQGKFPIFQRITIDCQRIDLSTSKYIEIAKWSAESYRAKGNSEEARSINAHLDKMSLRTQELEKKLFLKELDFSFENFKNELFDKKPKNRTIVPIFKDHNTKIKELVGQEYAPGTLERYETSLKHTIDFLQWKFNVSDIDITKIDHSFITEYEFYLRSVRKCANNTAIKYIKNFKKIIRLCIANGWLEKDPFVNYKSKVKEVIREFLTETEIETMLNKQFSIQRLELVRDIFIFSCFTGLAYIDVQQLTKDNIGIGIDGSKWIFKNRQKTDTASKIPLLPVAEMIIQKYADNPESVNKGKLLPILSNQKMNAYLKEIADVCGITKDLTFHIARHTFATTITLSNGVPLETVSKMLGHTNLKTTQHYAKILDKKISEDMSILKQKFALKEQNQVNEQIAN